MASASASPTKTKALAPAAVGIRLGNSTLSLAVARLGDGFNGKPTVVASETGERSTPTVVAWSNGEWIIGDAAKQQAAKNPKNTFMNLLKLLGAKSDDKEALKYCKGNTTSSSSEGDLLLQPIDISSNEPDGEAMNPIVLLSMLIKKLKELGEENAGHGGKVSPCIFTVPCDYNQLQCQAVNQAGVLAGFDVLQVIKEPVAICLAYKLDVSKNILKKSDALTLALKNQSKNNEYIMIVDIGGSDTSATILNCDNGMMSVLAHASSVELSGKLMVEEVVKFAAMFFKRKTGADPLDSKKSATRLYQTCEGTLRFLSNAPQADIEVESLYEGMDLRARLSRARFEDMCDFTTINKVIDEALAKASLSREQMDRVILGGGAARVPKIQSKVSDMFKTEVVLNMNKEQPDEAGALGAALQAGRLVCDHSNAVKNTNGQGMKSIGTGALGGSFMRDYKKTDLKLHKEIPEKVEISSLSYGISLKFTDGGDIQSLVSNGSYLPIQSHCHVFKSLKSTSNGEFVMDLYEDNDSSSLATFTFHSLSKNVNNMNLICFLSIDIKGNMSGLFRMIEGENLNDETLLKLYSEEEPKEGSLIEFEIPSSD